MILIHFFLNEIILLIKDFLAKMANLSGISPTELTMYQMWKIADHIMVNEAHNLLITGWQKENMNRIMFLNDYVFYPFGRYGTEEMSKLVGGLYLKKTFVRLYTKYNHLIS